MQGKNVVETSPRPRISRFEPLSLSEGRWFTTKSDGMWSLPLKLGRTSIALQHPRQFLACVLDTRRGHRYNAVCLFSPFAGVQGGIASQRALTGNEPCLVP